jgi:hypothetical protein
MGLINAHDSDSDGGLGGLMGAYSDSDDDGGSQAKASSLSLVDHQSSSGVVLEAAQPAVPAHDDKQPLPRNQWSTQRALRLLPPAPTSSAGAERQANITKLLAEHEQGPGFTRKLVEDKAFHNPYLQDKAMKRFGLEEGASAFPRDAYDPAALDEQDYHDQLKARVQAEAALVEATAARAQAKAAHEEQVRQQEQLQAQSAVPAVLPSSTSQVQQTAAALRAQLAARTLSQKMATS